MQIYLTSAINQVYFLNTKSVAIFTPVFIVEDESVGITWNRNESCTLFSLNDAESSFIRL